MKNDKKMVEQITSMDTDFAQWYTDVVKKAELIDNDLKFLSVALEEGENVVEFPYSSPYVKYAGVGFAFAVLALGLLALIVIKTKLLEKLSPVISWAGVLLAAGVVAFFFLYPIGVNVTKWIELIRALL